MRIAVTADIHWGSRPKGDASTRAMVDALEEEAPDVLILAGDLGSHDPGTVRECLDLFSTIEATRLFVSGNHDIWTGNGDSEEIFRHTLPAIGREHGFHYLEGAPKIVDGVGFAGTMGWYDYSFRDEGLGLDLSDYRRKYFRGVCTWNDRRFIRWGYSDDEFTDLLVEELGVTLEALSEKVDTIVAITHHLPFIELVRRYPNLRAWAFSNAFMGSGRIGEAILRFPRVRHHFCGHSHVRAEVRKGPLRSVSIGSTYLRKRYEVLELDDASAETGPAPV